MRRASLGLVVGAAILLCAAPARGDQSCRPVNGHFEARLVPPADCASPVGVCTSGRVWGGLRGTYFFTMESLAPTGQPAVPSILFFTGKSDIRIAGGTVQGVDTGTIDLPPGAGGFASLITFTGGTGAGAGTSGQIRLRGELDAASGITSGDYVGMMCRPK
jgi:hypothetical protein